MFFLKLSRVFTVSLYSSCSFASRLVVSMILELVLDLFRAISIIFFSLLAYNSFKILLILFNWFWVFSFSSTENMSNLPAASCTLLAFSLR